MATIKEDKISILEYLHTNKHFEEHKGVFIETIQTYLGMRDDPDRFNNALRSLLKDGLVKQINRDLSITSEGTEYYEDFLDARPINQPSSVPPAPQKNIIKSIWNWVMNNPMSATIIGGIIVMIVGTIILKRLHLT